MSFLSQVSDDTIAMHYLHKSWAGFLDNVGGRIRSGLHESVGTDLTPIFRSMDSLGCCGAVAVSCNHLRALPWTDGVVFELPSSSCDGI